LVAFIQRGSLGADIHRNGTGKAGCVGINRSGDSVEPGVVHLNQAKPACKKNAQKTSFSDLSFRALSGSSIPHGSGPMGNKLYQWTNPRPARLIIDKRKGLIDCIKSALLRCRNLLSAVATGEK
jgi:hypothetical protein